LCDISEDTVTDPSAASIHFDAIFVDERDGDDNNDGSRQAPKKTLQAGGQAALDAGKDVYVEDGTYTLSSEFSITSGVMFYGGFTDGFGARDTTGSILQTTESTVLVVADGTDAGTGLDGFELENNLSVAGSPIVIEATNANLTLRNNQIRLNNTGHGTGIDAMNSTLTLTNNDIEVYGGDNTGVGVILDGVEGSFADNRIQIRDFQVSRTAIQCVSAGATDISLEDNQLDVWAGAAAEDSSLVYVLDCSISPSRSHFEIPLPGTFDFTGFVDDGGNSLDGLF